VIETQTNIHTQMDPSLLRNEELLLSILGTYSYRLIQMGHSSSGTVSTASN